MQKIKVKMYNKEGMLISKSDGTPFIIKICEIQDGKEVSIPFEEGDKLEIVEE